MTKARDLTVVTAVLSAVTVGVLGFVGGWHRRWISDDGLIVLRTVRNLLAGNGPVFNAGERVETNTSTLWQYLIYVVALISDAPLETIAMWCALTLTTLALAIAAWATAKLYRTGALLVPLGGLMYIATPPARDFATSGLEWGLSIFWIAVQWLLLVRWVQAGDSAPGAHAKPSRDWATCLLALWSGLSWLVRPELALYGGMTGLLLLVTAGGARKAAAILAWALPIPAAYQIFRMGYYGLIVPHTAVAKSASGSAWGSGMEYLRDFADPYALYLGLAAAALAGAFVVLQLLSDGHRVASRFRLRSTVGIIVLVVVCASLHVLYVLRVGGDFMHGRMLLLPMFTLLLPVAVVKVWDTDTRFGFAHAGALASVAGGIWWSGSAVIGGHPYTLPQDTVNLGVVDERAFWTILTATGHAPQTAQDYLGMGALNGWQEAMEEGLANNDSQFIQYSVDPDSGTVSWKTLPRTTEDTDLAGTPLTMTLINLGMTGMNSPLNVRVVDNMGLANPIAARQPRNPDGRIGHDKNLPIEWQLADSAMPVEATPDYYNQDGVFQARQDLYTEDFQRLFASYRAPMNASRFFSNIKFSLTLGRTLELNPDVYSYADQTPVDDPQPIRWDYEIKLDQPRQ